MSLLELDSISHVFPNGKVALKSINLCIPPSSFSVLAGPNGSGKTVLMRHMNGLALPSSGAVLLDGKNIHENLAETRRRIGLVFQDADAQIVGQTVARDTAFGPENLRLPREEITLRVKEALEATGLVGFDDRRPHTLSGGEKRRLAVAGVIAMKPDILVLDEPFTGLDWPGSARLLDVLDSLHSGGTAILVITHDLEKILAHADTLILMRDSEIVAEDEPENLIDRVEEFGIKRPVGPVSSMSWRQR